MWPSEIALLHAPVASTASDMRHACTCRRRPPGPVPGRQRDHGAPHGPVQAAHGVWDHRRGRRRGQRAQHLVCGSRHGPPRPDARPPRLASGPHARLTELVLEAAWGMYRLVCVSRLCNTFGCIVGAIRHTCSQVALWPARVLYRITGPTNTSLATQIFSTASTRQLVRDAARLRCLRVTRTACTWL